MRNLKLKLNNPNEILNEFTEQTLNNLALEMDSLTYMTYDEKYYGEDGYVDFITVLADYFYNKCIEDCLKNKTLKFKQIEKFIDFSDLYVELISVELEQYFFFNDVLNENVFLRFNLKQLKSEIQEVIKKVEFKLKTEKDFKELRKKVKEKNEIDLLDYNRVCIDFTDDEGLVIYSRKKGEYISILNIREKLGLNIKLNNYEDDWQTAINLTVYSILALNIKEVYIKDSLMELMKVVSNNILIRDKKISVKVFETK